MKNYFIAFCVEPANLSYEPKLTTARQRIHTSTVANQPTRAIIPSTTKFLDRR